MTAEPDFERIAFKHEGFARGVHELPASRRPEVTSTR